VTLRPLAADHPDALGLIAELDAELNESTPKEHMFGLHKGEAADPRLRFFVVDLDGAIVGCGALRELEAGVAELKRMYIRRAYRRRGLGRVLLESLEREAVASGIHTLKLETGWMLTEAVRLYHSAGFVDIPAYGEYVTSPFSLCMEKPLSARA
jgi:GNAT superfamily N-acetyltransferase